MAISPVPLPLETQREFNRLALALARACPGATIQSARMHTLDVVPDREEFYARVIVESHDGDGMDEAKVLTRCRPSSDDAVAELRSILRADTDGAVADVLDELVTLAEEGLFSVEMLRTMARARRAK